LSFLGIFYSKILIKTKYHYIVEKASEGEARVSFYGENMTNEHTIGWKERLEIEIAGAITHIHKLHEYVGVREKILKHYREMWFEDEESEVPLTDSELRNSSDCSCLPYRVRSDYDSFYRGMEEMNSLDRGSLRCDLYPRRIKGESFSTLLRNAIAGTKTNKFRILPQNFLEDLEAQLAEHLATPYSDQPLPPRLPYQAREITSEQLPEHLRKMEARII